jgi:predicted acylesterase/phospholipase RssA
MTIKHLVISGGGPVLIQILGAIQHLEESKFLNLSEIETIYGTSAGAIVGILISLNFDWETINDYVIKRPWHDVFPIKVQNIFDAYSKKGLFDNTNIEKCFKPLLDAKDIPLDINLEDFYKLTNKEIHFYSFEINEYKIQDISYLTHPKLSLIHAIQMTSALPILISPVCIEDKCYIDGGVSSNYPLNYCIESGKNPDEILGFKNKYSDSKNTITSESTILDFLMGFLYKAVFSVCTYYNQLPIKYEVIFDREYVSFKILRNTLSNIEVRKDLLKNGIESAKEFLSKLKEDILQDSIQELSESSL